MILVAMSVFAVCIFCTVNIVLNFGSDIVYLLLALIGGFVLLGMIFAFSAVYITEKGNRYHNQKTCSGLKRSVRLVKESGLSGIHACSRCG